MKVRKIIARNMSEGLKAISAELGDDAMILSNRKVPQGVEILAAVKPEAQTPVPQPTPRSQLPDMTQGGWSADDSAPAPSWSTQPEAQPDRQSAQPVSATNVRRDDDESLEDSIIRMSERDQGGLSRDSLLALLNKHKDPLEQKRRKLRAQIHQDQAAPTTPSSRPALSTPSKPSTPATPSTPSRRKPAQATASDSSPKPVNAGASQQDLSAMREELTALREWLETSEYRVNQGDTNSHPLARRLDSLAMHPRCIAPMLEKYRDLPLEKAWRQTCASLGRIAESDASCLIRKGGVAALVGPTGAGKTTTLSKIATRFAMEHGSQDLGIISLDQYRIGAHEPVRVLGRILGCEVILSDTQDELEQHLARLSDKKLILIDTNGSERGLQAFRDQLGGSLLESQIQPLLVLPSNLSKRSVDQAWQRFGVLRPRGLVLTKADESAEIGPIISLSLLKKVPLVYWSDGTLVPQDLHFGEVGPLIERCHVQLDAPVMGEKLIRIG